MDDFVVFLVPLLMFAAMSAAAWAAAGKFILRFLAYREVRELGATYPYLPHSLHMGRLGSKRKCVVTNKDGKGMMCSLRASPDGLYVAVRPHFLPSVEAMIPPAVLSSARCINGKWPAWMFSLLRSAERAKHIEVDVQTIEVTLHFPLSSWSAALERPL